MWALGYHQSKWGYRTESAVREEAKAFQERNLPLSAIHLDIDCQVGYRAFTIDPERFPKLASFTQELAEIGVQFIAILNPGIKYSPHSNLFLEGQILVRLANSLELTREEQGDYPFSYTSVKLHLHGMKLQQAWVDDVEVTCQGQQLECDRFFKIRLQVVNGL